MKFRFLMRCSSDFVTGAGIQADAAGASWSVICRCAPSTLHTRRAGASPTRVAHAEILRHCRRSGAGIEMQGAIGVAQGLGRGAFAAPVQHPGLPEQALDAAIHGRRMHGPSIGRGGEDQRTQRAAAGAHRQPLPRRAARRPTGGLIGTPIVRPHHAHRLQPVGELVETQCAHRRPSGRRPATPPARPCRARASTAWASTHLVLRARRRPRPVARSGNPARRQQEGHRIVFAIGRGPAPPGWPDCAGLAARRTGDGRPALSGARSGSDGACAVAGHRGIRRSAVQTSSAAPAPLAGPAQQLRPTSPDRRRRSPGRSHGWPASHRRRVRLAAPAAVSASKRAGCVRSTPEFVLTDAPLAGSGRARPC